MGGVADQHHGSVTPLLFGDLVDWRHMDSGRVLELVQQPGARGGEAGEPLPQPALPSA